MPCELGCSETGSNLSISYFHSFHLFSISPIFYFPFLLFVRKFLCGFLFRFQWLEDGGPTGLTFIIYFPVLKLSRYTVHSKFMHGGCIFVFQSIFILIFVIPRNSLRQMKMKLQLFLGFGSNKNLSQLLQSKSAVP